MARNLLSSRSSLDSEMNDTNSTIGGKTSDGELALSARALLREHSERMDSSNSLDVTGGTPKLSAPFPVNLQDILKKEVGNSKKKKSPKEVKKQREVVMSYKINCVSDISAILCTVEVDLKVFFHWCDEALIGRKNGTTIVAGDEKGLFDPDIVISNEHNIQEISSVAKVTNSETGEVKCSKHYKGTVFLTSMDLRLFPFDCQNLQICFKPYKKSIEEVIMIRSDPAECAMESRIAHEWDILGHCMKVFETDPLTSSTKKVYSTIYLTVLTRRKAGWFVANIFVPTFLMLVVSWLTFIYEPHGARSDRNDVSMSTLLLSISNKFVVGDAMPKVDYRTLVDIYVDTCFYLQVLTMLANAVVEKYQDMPFLGAFGRHLNLIFFLLELIAAFCLHEWFFVSLWNHRADILDWVEASKDKDVNSEVAGHQDQDIELGEGEYDDGFSGIERVAVDGSDSYTSSTTMTSLNNVPTLMLPAREGAEWQGSMFDDQRFQVPEVVGLRQRSGRRMNINLGDGPSGFDDAIDEMTFSSGNSSPRNLDGQMTPPYMGYIQPDLSPLQVDFSNLSTRHSYEVPPLSPLMQGIMLQRDQGAVQQPASFASSTSSFFSNTTRVKPSKMSRRSSERGADILSPLLSRAESREIYKSRPRRVSSVSTLLVFIERVTGPAGSWVGTNRHSSLNGLSAHDSGVSRRISSPHFTDFGASGVTPVVVKNITGINEARRLQTNIHNERANVVSEIFKRHLSRAGLKEALAQRNERKIERAREMERQDEIYYPKRGASIGSYFGSSRTSPDERMHMTVLQNAEWEEKEEFIIRNMAAKELQARWRMIRARRQLLVLRNLRDQALLEGYASRIQRTFRLRRMLRNIKKGQDKTLISSPIWEKNKEIGK